MQYYESAKYSANLFKGLLLTTLSQTTPFTPFTLLQFMVLGL